MKSRRKEVQKWWESKLGCTNLDNWTQYKSQLTTSVLSVLDIQSLEIANETDRINYGINAILSFLEGIESIKSRHFSWGIIKLYYSIFYSLRYEILIHDYILVRCKGLYILKLSDGEQFKEVRDNKKSGDHQLTIKAERDLVNAGVIIDPVLDNEIDGESPYLWLMAQRERVNYRQQCFSDPESDDCVLRPYQDYISEDKCKELFELYTNDSMLVYLFDKDHSMIAIPFYRISRIFENLPWNKVRSKTKSHILSMCNQLKTTIWLDQNNLHSVLSTEYIS